MEPSRCKTTSTVTLACKFRPGQQATSKVSGSTIVQTQYMTYRRKDKNPNIQPYKIIQHTLTPLQCTLWVREKRQSVCG